MTVELLSIPGAANRLACSRMTIYRLISEGDLRVVMVRNAKRVRADDVAKYIEKQTAKPTKKASRP